jgi:hypothetical protein
VTTALGAAFACEFVTAAVVESESSSSNVAVSRPKAIVVMGAHVTVTVSSSWSVPACAEIVATPAASAVTTPLLLTVAMFGADVEYDTSEEVPVVEPSDMVSVAPTGTESSARRFTASELNARLVGVGGGVDSLQDNVARSTAATARKRDKDCICLWA